MQVKDETTLKLHTHPHVLTVHEHLRHQDVIATHAFPYFRLIFAAHEHIPLLVLHQERPQDLLDFHAGLVRVPEDAHCGRVHHHLPGIPVILKTKTCLLSSNGAKKKALVEPLNTIF